MMNTHKYLPIIVDDPTSEADLSDVGSGSPMNEGWGDGIRKHSGVDPKTGYGCGDRTGRGAFDCNGRDHD